jgi:AcrR family transcriptional regulator
MTRCNKQRDWRDIALDAKKIRILETTARVVCQNGIAGAKIGVLIPEAGVARETFYDIFESKQNCLEQTLSWVGAECRDVVEAVSPSSSAGIEAVARQGLAALLDFIVERPEQARYYLLHGPAISLSNFTAEQDAFARLLGSFCPDASTQTMVVGGITETLRHHLTERPDEDPRRLLDGFVALVVATSRVGLADLPVAA